MALLYAHALLQRRRDKSGHPYRVVFTAATVMLSVLAAGTLLDVVVPSSDVLRGGYRPAIAVILALVAANLVNFGLVLHGGWLLFRPPSMRAKLPTAGALGYELAAAVLGIVTAGFLLLMPPGTPVVLVLIAVLRVEWESKRCRAALSLSSGTAEPLRPVWPPQPCSWRWAS